MVALRRARRGLVLLVGVALLLVATGIMVAIMVLDWAMGRLP